MAQCYTNSPSATGESCTRDTWQTPHIHNRTDNATVLSSGLVTFKHTYTYICTVNNSFINDI